VRITSGHGTLSGLAARTSPCAACGVTLYREREFPVAVQTAHPDGVQVALEMLLAWVARWRQEPICCKRCPERLVAR
jgi:hypothetical protein